MANDLYRGYEIKPHINGGFYWTDERGFDHTGNIYDEATHIDARQCYHMNEEDCMNDIDDYKRNMMGAA